MNENGTQETKTCGWCQAVMVDEAAELRQEIEQLEAIVERLKAERNNARLVAQANKDAAARIGEQLDEACKRTEYWRGRCLAAEMQEHKAQWWEG